MESRLGLRPDQCVRRPGPGRVHRCAVVPVRRRHRPRRAAATRTTRSSTSTSRSSPAPSCRYRIFPEHTEDDLSYPSTYAAVDLAFSDGTYLSDLSAVDHHGFGLSPRAQGASKGLSTNQWNHVESKIGAVAAGKTVKRILVGYDKPAGPADFRGWVDDIAIGSHGDDASVAAETARTHPSELAITNRGTHSSGGFSRGNNFPATAVPHGFNFWTPVTNAGSQSGCTSTRPGEQRRRTAGDPGVLGQPRAEPVDG